MVEPFPPGHLLVLRPRRPDPTPPARAFPPSRARRSRGRFPISPLAGAVALLSAALLLVGASAAATQASYQIASLKIEQARLTTEYDQLQAQLAADQAANRVANAAQQLGMAHPNRWQYLSSAGSPIALGSQPADQSHRGIWANVLAVLDSVIGRPLSASASTN